MTALWPAEMNSEVLLLMVSLQKLYFDPPRVIAVFCDRSRWRAPQLELVLPLPSCPFQQTLFLLPLIVSPGVTVATGSRPLSLLVAASPWFTGGRMTGPSPTTVAGLVQLESVK